MKTKFDVPYSGKPLTLVSFMKLAKQMKKFRKQSRKVKLKIKAPSI